MEFYVSMFHPSELWALFRFKFLAGDVLVSSPLTQEERGSEDMVRCYEYLARTSRSFAAVIRCIRDDTLRPAVAVFYLVLRALDTVEDDMSIPKDEKVTMLRSFSSYLDLEAWSYDKSTDKDKIVLEDFPSISRAFRQLPDSCQIVIRETAGQMGDGLASYLDKRIVSVADWDEYCLYAAGLVGVGLTRLFTSGGDGTSGTEVMERSIGMGRFLQKTNITRDYFEDARDGRLFWPEEVWRQYGDTSDTFLAEENVARGVACLNHLITLTLHDVPKVLEFLTHLSELTNDRSVFNFCAIPQVMAIATLLLCYDNKNVFRRSVKIRKGETVSLMLEATSLEGVRNIFSRYAQLIKDRIRLADPNASETARVCDVIITQCGAQTGDYVIRKYAVNSSLVLLLALLGYKYGLYARVMKLYS